MPTVATSCSYHVAVGLAPGEGERQQDVLLRVEHRHEVEALEDEAEPVAPQARQRAVVEARELGAVDRDGAGRRAVQAGEQVHERRLARARGPHDGGEAARREVDRHVDEGVHGGVALAEGAAQVDGGDDGRRGARGRIAVGRARCRWRRLRRRRHGDPL